MVGVPGKSKGCNTCRRRKKGCDLQQPSCGQCLNAGLRCEGYARDTIFVNTGPQIPNPGQRTIERSEESQNISEDSWSASLVHLPPKCSSAANARQITSLFWSHYIPDTLYDDSYLVSTPGVWSDTIQSMSLSERSLELSYIAISCGRIGKDFNDPRLLQQGWRAYCGGMRELQRALTDPQRTWTVETLAASQLLGMYELFEGVTPGFTAWMTHVRGATKLIEARGPGSYSNDLAYRLFLGHRLQEIITALRTRSPSPFASELWRTLPFQHRAKDLREQLLDILLQVPEVTGRAFALSEAVESDPADTREQVTQQLLSVLEQFWFLDTKLVEWYERVESVSSKPLFQREYLGAAASEESSLQARVTFPDIRTGHTLAIYWTICHMVYERMHRAYSSLITATAVTGIGSHPQTNPPALPQRTNPTSFALLATESVEYFLQPNMRALGRVIASWPTMAALDFFSRNPAPEPLSKPKMMRWFVIQSRKIDMRGMPAPFQGYLTKTADAASRGMKVKQEF